MASVATVDDYLESLPPETRARLEEVRAAIRRAVPGGDEVISYGIPTFKLDGRYVVYFAGWKRHISIYPIPPLDDELAERIGPYEAGRGTLRFPLDKPIPLDLVESVARRLVEARGQARPAPVPPEDRATT